MTREPPTPRSIPASKYPSRQWTLGVVVAVVLCLGGPGNELRFSDRLFFAGVFATLVVVLSEILRAGS